MEKPLQLRQRVPPHSSAVINLQNNPPKAFHQFTSLPRELRDIIWQYALLVPRVVRVQASFMSYCCVTYFDEHGEMEDMGHTYFGKFYSNPPPLFHACHESRELALLQYELCMTNMSDNQMNFHGQSKIEDHPGDESGIWLQADLDTIHMPFPTLNSNMIWHEADVGDIKMKNVRNIAVDVENAAGEEYHFDGIMEHSNHIFAKVVNGDKSRTLQNFFMVFEGGKDEDILLKEVQEINQQGSCDLFEDMDPAIYRFPQYLAMTLKRFMVPENSECLVKTAFGSYILASSDSTVYLPYKAGLGTKKSIEQGKPVQEHATSEQQQY